MIAMSHLHTLIGRFCDPKRSFWRKGVDVVNMIQYASGNLDTPTRGELHVAELCVRNFAAAESEYGTDLIDLWEQRERLRTADVDDLTQERSLLRDIHLEYTSRIRDGPKREKLQSDLCQRWSSLIREND